MQKTADIANQTLKRRKKGCCATLKYICTGEKDYVYAQPKSTGKGVSGHNSGLIKRQKISGREFKGIQRGSKNNDDPSQLLAQGKDRSFEFEQILNQAENEELQQKGEKGQNGNAADGAMNKYQSIIQQMKKREQELLERIKNMEALNASQTKLLDLQKSQISRLQGDQNDPQDSNSQNCQNIPIDQDQSQRISLNIETQKDDFKAPNPVTGPGNMRLPDDKKDKLNQTYQSDGGIQSSKMFNHVQNPEAVRPRRTQSISETGSGQGGGNSQGKLYDREEIVLDNVLEKQRVQMKKIDGLKQMLNGASASQPNQLSDSNKNRETPKKVQYQHAYNPNPVRFSSNQSFASRSQSTEKYAHLQPTSNPFRDYVNRRKYLASYYTGPPLYAGANFGGSALNVNNVENVNPHAMSSSIQQKVTKASPHKPNGIQQKVTNEQNTPNSNLLNLDSQTQQQHSQTQIVTKSNIPVQSQERIDLTTNINSQQQPPKPLEEPKAVEEVKKTGTQVFFKAPVSSGKSVFKIAPSKPMNTSASSDAGNQFMKFMQTTQQPQEKQQAEGQDKQHNPKLENGKVTMNPENKENKSLNPIEKQILDQNQQIIENQKKLKSERVFAKVNAQNLNKNQNYTAVPNNSQVSFYDKPSYIIQSFQFSDTMEQPDEDCREDYNLLGANAGILKGLAANNQETISDIQSHKSSVLQRLAAKVNSQFAFLKKPLKLFSVQDILTEDAWQQFASRHSQKLASADVDTVAILSSPEIIKNSDEDLNKIEMQGIDLILITEDKICKLCLTTQESAILWSESSENGGSPGKDNTTPEKGFKGGHGDSLEDRLKSIFEMLNGKVDTKLLKAKPMFGNQTNLGFMPKPTTPPTKEPQGPIEVPEPERAKDTVLVKDGKPLYALFGLLRYYLFQEKYKAIIKFNLNHRAYFSKRDEIIKLAQQESLQEYWLATILSLICV